MGSEPNKTITSVNTNAVFAKGIGLPQVDDVLNYAKKGSGITFVIVFYHSWIDFDKPRNYKHLNDLLTTLTNDSTIEISSIGEIAEKYQNTLQSYNQSGLNIKEADNAKNRAKPYLLIYRIICTFLGKDLSIDELYNKAFVAYWSGDYKHASKLAIEIVEKSNNYIVKGRIIFVLNSLMVFLIFLSVMRYKKIKPTFRHYRNLLLIFVVPFLIIGAYLNIFQPFSTMRNEEFNIASGLFLGGITVLAYASYAFQKKNKYINH